MDTCILNPEWKKGDPDLPRTGILAVNPTDARGFSSLAKSLGLRRYFLFHSNLHASDALFLAGPAVGAPMAVMVLEKLIALGAEQVILYGWAGSLQRDLHAMNLLLPDGGISEEGTSRHYPTANPAGIVPDSLLHQRLRTALDAARLPCRTGLVWTTDAPYRETRTRVEQYCRQGVCGVDMEFSALCTVAAFRGIRFAALLLISDELLRHPWTPQYSFTAFTKRSGDMLALLCDFARRADREQGGPGNGSPGMEQAVPGKS